MARRWKPASRTNFDAIDHRNHKEQEDVFVPENKAQEKRWEMLQAKGTKVDKDSNGVCYVCEKDRYVVSTLLDVCVRCAAKKKSDGHRDLVMTTTELKYQDYCYLCGQYPKPQNPFYNSAVLNVRICQGCNDKVKERGKELNKVGYENKDPFFLALKKLYGKDWYDLAGFRAKPDVTKRLEDWVDNIVMPWYNKMPKMRGSI